MKSINRLTRHRRIIPWIIYLIMLAALAVWVSNRGGAISYVFFFTVLLYPVAALIHIFYTRAFLKRYQEVDGRLLYKMTSVDYQIFIECAGIFPMAGIKLTALDEVTLFGENFADQIYTLLPREKVKLNTSMTCKYAGAYTAGIGKVTLEDCFGLFKITYDIPIPLRVNVLPIVTDIAGRDINKLYTEVMNGVRSFRLDKSENYLGNDVRRYIEGDSVNTIHWKNYARTGEMMVRLPEKQDSEMMNVGLVTAGDEADITKRDFMLEYIVSFADWFARQKKPVRFVYYSGSIKDYLVESYDSFQKFYLEVLPEIGRESRSSNDEEILEETRRINGIAAIYKESEGELVAIDR